MKSTGDYSASLVETMLKSYLKTAGIYNSKGMSEKDVINNTNKTLDKNVKVKVTSKLDVDNLTNAARYFNFTNYCMLAGCIYVIGVVLASFREDKIRKRTVISGINYKKYNNQLLISNGLFAIVLWLAYVVLGFILIGKIMFSVYGLLFIANSFVFTICVLTLAFFISNLVSNKDALNGIVNVIALGSSFLCGAFVPMQWLPDGVLKVAHIFPSYYFIKNNEIIKTIEKVELNTIKPIIVNGVIILVFAIVFIVVNNIITSRKRTFA